MLTFIDDKEVSFIDNEETTLGTAITRRSEIDFSFFWLFNKFKVYSRLTHSTMSWYCEKWLCYYLWGVPQKKTLFFFGGGGRYEKILTEGRGMQLLKAPPPPPPRKKWTVTLWYCFEMPYIPFQANTCVSSKLTISNTCHIRNRFLILT